MIHKNCINGMLNECQTIPHRVYGDAKASRRGFRVKGLTIEDNARAVFAFAIGATAIGWSQIRYSQIHRIIYTLVRAPFELRILFGIKVRRAMFP
jgi:hypothetical protein